jgi:hypothetical protein
LPNPSRAPTKTEVSAIKALTDYCRQYINIYTVFSNIIPRFGKAGRRWDSRRAKAAFFGLVCCASLFV